jgi:glucose/arabinose dehydrogenase
MKVQSSSGWTRGARAAVAFALSTACGTSSAPQKAAGSCGSPGGCDAAADAHGSDGGPPGVRDASVTAGDGAAADGAAPDASPPLPAACNGSVRSPADAGAAPTVASQLTAPAGFRVENVATILSPRQAAPLPNGDLLVATNAPSVYLVSDAEASGAAGAPVVFAQLPETAQGIAYVPSICTILVGTIHAVYAIPYTDGQVHATVGAAIAQVRGGPPGSTVDTDNHQTTGVAFAGGKVFAGVGSSCNACVEIDPTRATIQEMDLTGANMTARAKRFRNPIALATNPATGTLWAGGAGQDDLPTGHPYEFFDAVTAHDGVADYGWPFCEENQHAYSADASCAATIAPRIELPAYSTIIAAAFYPASPSPTAAYAFPPAYRGGLFLTTHGSWHTDAENHFLAPPRVLFVPMQGDAPATPVDWSDPTKQWSEFLGGFQPPDGGARIGRVTGIAVGVQGSLFVLDDTENAVFRIRPSP